MQQKFVVNRRHVKRIKPFRPHRSRRRILGVASLSVLVVVVALSAWAQRSESFVNSDFARTSTDPELKAVVVESLAGPVVISEGQRPLVQGSSSWLFRRPTVDARIEQDNRSRGQADLSNEQLRVNTGCSSAFPCRVALRVEVVNQQQLIVRSTGTLSVERFEGAADLEAVGDHSVLVSRTTGSLTIRTGTGGVAGFALSSRDVDVHSDGGTVDLSFVESPTKLTVVAGSEPVVVELPAAAYAITINKESAANVTSDRLSIGEGIVHDANAAHRVEIQTSGPIELHAVNPAR